MDTVRHVVQVPADSRALTTLFHRRGLNMRYLGKVAGLFDQIAEFPVSTMGDLLKEEMVARACKGILRAFLKVTPIHFVGTCISHFFNCLFASEGCDVSVIFTNEHQKLVDQDWQALTTDSLKEMVISLVNQKFRYKVAAPLVSLSPSVYLQQGRNTNRSPQLQLWQI